MMERVPQPVREMLALLRESGRAPYLVGGCVRDLLRGAEPDDYDMTSDARPEEVMALFGADAHPTGLMHGTVTLVRGGLAVEHTTERCDGAYRDSRHPESVRFTSSIEEDLARRDFTVNAIALAPDERLVDPFGGREASCAVWATRRGALPRMRSAFCACCALPPCWAFRSRKTRRAPRGSGGTACAPSRTSVCMRS